MEKYCRRKLQPLVLGLGLVTSACTKVEFERQELKLTHDAEQDIMDLDLEYIGLVSGNSGLEAATDWLQGVLGKKPRFIAMGWPFEFDLNEIGVEWLLEHVTVERARVTTVEGPVLQLDQSVRFHSIQEALIRASAAIAAGLIQNYGEANLEEEADGWVDADTLRLALEQARRGDPWMTLDDGGLHFHLPCSPVLFHLALLNIADPPQMEERDRFLLRQAISQLGSMAYSNGRLDLAFPFEGERGLRLTATHHVSPRDDHKAFVESVGGK